jgi:hypothetical protein
MSKQLRKALTDELQRRHGYKVMETKIKPVHIANALMRSEHRVVGCRCSSSCSRERSLAIASTSG